MASRRIRLVFPQDRIQKPIVFSMAKECDVIPNIRQARITDTVGEMTLELEGKDDNLKRAVEYLKKNGVQVESVAGDTNS